MGYYGAPGYDGWYGYDGFGVLGLNGYPYGHRWDHGGWDHHELAGFHDGGGHPHFAFHGAPGGVSRGSGVPHGGFAHAAFGGHGGYAGGMRG